MDDYAGLIESLTATYRSGMSIAASIGKGATARGEVVARVLGVLDGLGLAGLAHIRPGDGTDWITVGS